MIGTRPEIIKVSALKNVESCLMISWVQSIWHIFKEKEFKINRFKFKEIVYNQINIVLHWLFKRIFINKKDFKKRKFSFKS